MTEPRTTLADRAYRVQLNNIDRMIRVLGDGDLVAEADVRTSLVDAAIGAQLAAGYTPNELDRNGYLIDPRPPAAGSGPSTG
jgi:hypothetical protein